MEKLSQAVLDIAPAITEAIFKQINLWVYLHIFWVVVGVALIVCGFVLLRLDLDDLEKVLAGVVWIAGFAIVVGNLWGVFVAIYNPIYYAITLLPK